MQTKGEILGFRKNLYPVPSSLCPALCSLNFIGCQIVQFVNCKVENGNKSEIILGGGGGVLLLCTEGSIWIPEYKLLNPKEDKLFMYTNEKTRLHIPPVEELI